MVPLMNQRVMPARGTDPGEPAATMCVPAITKVSVAHRAAIFEETGTNPWGHPWDPKPLLNGDPDVVVREAQGSLSRAPQERSARGPPAMRVEQGLVLRASLP